MRFAWVLGLLAGCGGTRATEVAVNPAEAPVVAPAFVVVSGAAWFYGSPDATGPRARAAVATGCGGVAPEGWTMRRVAVSGDWITLENLQSEEADAHCVGALDALDGWRLRLYLHASDLLRVTTREVDVALADGTGFTLSAGVPIDEPEVTGLPIPAPDVGTDYATPTRHLLAADHVADDDDLGLPGTAYLAGKPVNLRASAVEHTGTLYTLTNRCTQFRVRIPEEDGGTGWGTIGCGRPGELGEPGLPHVAAGARLTWPDGSAAGEALVEQVIRWPAPVLSSAGGRRCFRLPLRKRVDWPYRDHQQDDWFLTLCAEERDWISTSP